MTIQTVLSRGMQGWTRARRGHQRIQARMGMDRVCNGTGACEKNAPPEKKTCGKISSRSTKSGAGEHFLLQDCRAQSAMNGMFFRFSSLLETAKLTMWRAVVMKKIHLLERNIFCGKNALSVCVCVCVCVFNFMLRRHLGPPPYARPRPSNFHQPPDAFPRRTDVTPLHGPTSGSESEEIRLNFRIRIRGDAQGSVPGGKACGSGCVLGWGGDFGA